MITRIAVVPYPPLLVPELTVRPDAATKQLRASCLRAASSLTDVATRWVALGADRGGSRVLGGDVVGTFAGYGVPVQVSLGGEPGDAEPDPLMPLPALVAGWLRAQVGADEVTVHLLRPETSTEESRAYGVQLAEGTADRIGLLVLADGTQCRDVRSPRPPDARAEATDEHIKTALATADSASLLALEPGECSELGVEGRPALQGMAGAAESEGGVWSAELLHSGTPFGVTYHVAVWSRSDG